MCSSPGSLPCPSPCDHHGNEGRLRAHAERPEKYLRLSLKCPPLSTPMYSYFTVRRTRISIFTRNTQEGPPPSPGKAASLAIDHELLSIILSSTPARGCRKEVLHQQNPLSGTQIAHLMLNLIESPAACYSRTGPKSCCKGQIALA